MSSNNSTQPSILAADDFPALSSAPAPLATPARGVWGQKKTDSMVKLTKPNIPSSLAKTAPTETLISANNDLSGNIETKEEDTNKASPTSDLSFASLPAQFNEATELKETIPSVVALPDESIASNESFCKPYQTTTSESSLRNIWKSLESTDDIIPNVIEETVSTAFKSETTSEFDVTINDFEQTDLDIAHSDIIDDDSYNPSNALLDFSDWNSLMASTSAQAYQASSDTEHQPAPTFAWAVKKNEDTNLPALPDFPSLVSTPSIQVLSNAASTPSKSSPVPSTSIANIDVDQILRKDRKMMSRLSKGTKISLVTNCHSMSINSLTVYCYDVDMVKEWKIDNGNNSTKPTYSQQSHKKSDGDSNKRPMYRKESLTGARKDQKEKSIDHKDNTQKILEAVFEKRKMTDIAFAYDGARALYLLTKLEDTKHGKESMSTNIKKSELPKELREILFNNALEGHIHVSINLNSSTSELQLENLITEGQGDDRNNSVHTMIHIALLQNARNQNFIILGQNQIFESSKNAEPKNRADSIEKFDMRDLVKIGLRTTVRVADGGENNKGTPIMCLEHRKSNFFLGGPLSEVKQFLPVDFTNQRSCRNLLKGLEVFSILSDARMIITDFSAESLENKKYIDKKTKKVIFVHDQAAETTNKQKSDFDKNFKVAHTSFGGGNKTIYFYPIENLRVAPDQKFKQQHGSAPTPSTPEERVQETNRLAEKAGILKTNKFLEKFGLKVRLQPIVVNGWTLDQPIISYAELKGRTGQTFLDKNLTWKPSSKFVAFTPIEKVLILYRDSSREDNMRESLETFRKSLSVESDFLMMRIKIENIEIRKIANNELALKQILEGMSANPKTKRYIIYIDEKKDNPSHGKIKLDERETKIMVQHVASDEGVKRGCRSTTQHILMKMNMRNGGLNHRVKTNPPINQLWGVKSKTLIISYDVCHSSGARTYVKGEASFEPSVVGFGFNGTSEPEQVIGDFALQSSRTEKVDCDILKDKTVWMLNTYRGQRREWPTNIVILRDGVSEGQYEMTQKNELTAILQGVHEVMRSNRKFTERPKVAYIIATKRHALRLFDDETSRIINVPPMTAVDTGIVRKNTDEVIFVSHCPLSGTANPLMLNTLFSEILMSHDHLVSLVAALCCAHQRSTTAISLPETIFTADAYAKRGAEMFEEYSNRLRSRNEELPKFTNGEPNWSEITKNLCYQDTEFALRCMV